MAAMTAFPHIVNNYDDFVRESARMQALSDLNNRALQLTENGDHVAAEALYRRALAMKEAQSGPNSVTAALTRNALGDVLRKQGKLDEAEDNLRIAVEIRNNHDFHGLDAAVSRDNLARVLEAQGKWDEARALRLTGAPASMVCGSDNCSGGIVRHDTLRACAKCKCVYYCSVACQSADWKARHKAVCRKD